MLSIILGLVIGISVVILFLILQDNFFEGIPFYFLGCIIGVAIAVFGVGYGLFGINAEYKEVVLKEEIELISFEQNEQTSEENKETYIFISDEGVYTYMYEVEDKYELGEKAYKMGSIISNTTVVESKECKKPVLKVYIKEPKTSLFTFNLGATPIEERVFYVPEGTVKKEIKTK